MCPLRADTLKPFIEQGTVTFAEPEIAGTLLPATQDSQEMPVPALEIFRSNILPEPVVDKVPPPDAEES
jgi:hypothetical protein